MRSSLPMYVFGSLFRNVAGNRLRKAAVPSECNPSSLNVGVNHQKTCRLSRPKIESSISVMCVCSIRRSHRSRPVTSTVLIGLLESLSVRNGLAPLPLAATGNQLELNSVNRFSLSVRERSLVKCRRKFVPVKSVLSSELPLSDSTSTSRASANVSAGMDEMPDLSSKISLTFSKSAKWSGFSVGPSPAES